MVPLIIKDSKKPAFKGVHPLRKFRDERIIALKLHGDLSEVVSLFLIAINC